MREKEKEIEIEKGEENERVNFIFMNSHGIVGVGKSKICRADLQFN